MSGGVPAACVIGKAGLGTEGTDGGRDGRSLARSVGGWKGKREEKEVRGKGRLRKKVRFEG